MQAYLKETFGWSGVQWCGWIKRQRRRAGHQRWESENQHVWIAGGAFELSLGAEQAATLLRGHWSIENGVFYVRDRTMDEDRLHGRKIGLGLSSIRNAVLNLLRYLIPAPYIPDARRKVAAMPDHGLHLLTSHF